MIKTILALCLVGIVLAQHNGNHHPPPGHDHHPPCNDGDCGHHQPCPDGTQPFCIPDQGPGHCGCHDAAGPVALKTCATNDDCHDFHCPHHQHHKFCDDQGQCRCGHH